MIGYQQPMLLLQARRLRDQTASKTPVTFLGPKSDDLARRYTDLWLAVLKFDQEIG